MANKIFNQATIEAARTYLHRQCGIEKPEGVYDRGGRWYPKGKDEEIMARVRSPSREFPCSYLKAAQTIKHCAALHGACDKEVRRLLKMVGEAHPFPTREQIKDWITGSLDQHSEVPTYELKTAPAMGKRAMERL